jgi:hypothetical protein
MINAHDQTYENVQFWENQRDTVMYFYPLQEEKLFDVLSDQSIELQTFASKFKSLLQNYRTAYLKFKKLRRQQERKFNINTTYVDSLSDEDTSILKGYTYHNDRIYNAYLRGVDMFKIKEYKQEYRFADRDVAKMEIKNNIKKLNSIIYKSNIDRDVYVYRGVNFSKYKFNLDRLQIGNVLDVFENSFISTTFQPSATEGFTQRENTCCIFRILLRSGDYAMPLFGNSRFRDEHEVLLPTGTRFTVVGIYTEKINDDFKDVIDLTIWKQDVSYLNKRLVFIERYGVLKKETQLLKTVSSKKRERKVRTLMSSIWFDGDINTCLSNDHKLDTQNDIYQTFSYMKYILKKVILLLNNYKAYIKVAMSYLFRGGYMSNVTHIPHFRLDDFSDFSEGDILEIKPNNLIYLLEVELIYKSQAYLKYISNDNMKLDSRIKHLVDNYSTNFTCMTLDI